MSQVVFGDFNCPYSRLASHRLDALVAAGRAELEWRAVQHAPDLPVGGRAVEGAVAEELDRELAEIAELVGEGEAVTMRRPPVRPNTALATAAHAAAHPADRPSLRRRLFDALWLEGMDIGDELTLVSLGLDVVDPPGPAAEWQQAWEALDEPIVPAYVTADGTRFEGTAALHELGRRLRD